MRREAAALRSLAWMCAIQGAILLASIAIDVYLRSVLEAGDQERIEGIFRVLTVVWAVLGVISAASILFGAAGVPRLGRRGTWCAFLLYAAATLQVGQIVLERAVEGSSVPFYLWSAR